MTEIEAFELISQGGATDFADVIEICTNLGPYCLIGDLAVNCYVEPIYTMDADLVVAQESMEQLPERLSRSGFTVELFERSINARREASQLRFQFIRSHIPTTSIPFWGSEKIVLGQRALVASVEDAFLGKLGAWCDQRRGLTKCKKAELDLLRLAEAFPELRVGLPESLRSLLP